MARKQELGPKNQDLKNPYALYTRLAFNSEILLPLSPERPGLKASTTTALVAQTGINQRLTGADAEAQSQTLGGARGIPQKMGRKDCRSQRVETPQVRVHRIN